MARSLWETSKGAPIAAKIAGRTPCASISTNPLPDASAFPHTAQTMPSIAVSATDNAAPGPTMYTSEMIARRA